MKIKLILSLLAASIPSIYPVAYISVIIRNGTETRTKSVAVIKE